MENTLDLIQELYEIIDNDKDEVINYVAKCYTGIRLENLLLMKKLDEKSFNRICEDIVKQFINNDITIDIMVNSVYNYINKNNKIPPQKLLNEDIRALLEDYAEE